MLTSTIELYRILAAIAQHTPPTIEDGRELRCRRLQTLAVVNDYDAASATDTLGKDSRYIGKGIFYSRNWYDAGQSANYISAPYPQLLLGSMRENLQGDGATVRITYTVAIVDKANEKQAGVPNTTACDARTEEEVENDLRTLYLQFIANVRDVVQATLVSTVQPSASFAARWVSRTWLAAYLLTDPTAQVQELQELWAYVDFQGEAYFTKELGASDTYAYISSMQATVTGCRAQLAQVPPMDTSTLANTPCCP